MLNVSSPCSVYIVFTEYPPKLFELFDNEGRLYYFRYLDGRTSRIKFNIPDKGFYTSDVPFRVDKIKNIEIPEKLPVLPEAERDRLKPVEVVYNPELENTPARIFTDTGVIEVGRRFDGLPQPIKLFLLLHEQGHLFYKSEEKCDLFALVNFLRMGYNRSTGYYALAQILRRSRQNIDRVKNIFDNIEQYTGAFDPGIV